MILILCAQVFLAYKFLFAGGFGNKSLTVPNLVNMTLEEAQSAVEKEGLYLSVKSEEYNSEVDENCIISQTPEGGSTNVKKGDTINVVVSKGSSQASVPNVVGLTLSNAKQLIEENNLKVGTVKYEYSSIYKEGTVLNQSPGAGSSRAQEGDEVNLYVSKGSEKSNTQTPTVPDKNQRHQRIIHQQNLIQTQGTVVEIQEAQIQEIVEETQAIMEETQEVQTQEIVEEAQEAQTQETMEEVQEVQTQEIMEEVQEAQTQETMEIAQEAQTQEIMEELHQELAQTLVKQNKY